MKSTYRNAEIQIVSIHEMDVIRTSGAVASSYRFGSGDNGRSDRLEDAR